jgi:hypothetical protein
LGKFSIFEFDLLMNLSRLFCAGGTFVCLFWFGQRGQHSLGALGGVW